MFYTNLIKYSRQLQDVIDIFFHDISDIELYHEFSIENNFQVDTVVINGNQNKFTTHVDISNKNTIEKNRIILYNSKTALFKALSTHTNQSNSWGSITGVRPMAVLNSMDSDVLNATSIAKFYIEKYFVATKKAELIAQVYLNQAIALRQLADKLGLELDTNQRVTSYHNYINLYVHIPFCPSRCSYCSFITSDIKNNLYKKDYVQGLLKEIDRTIQLIDEYNLRVLSVYIGGGTPSFLDCEDIGLITSKLGRYGVEFCFEAGRVDTLDICKLNILKSNGVTRICINPQSFNEKTLQIIGRTHTVAQVIQVYNQAREIGFDINMDLICGLQDEKLSDFMHTINQVIALQPDNVTMHTLCLKRGATNTNLTINQYTQDMLDYGYLQLGQNGYTPYYLYKQKNALYNLENCGLAKLGKECMNNITTMEDTVPVVGIGAGAISKVLENSGKIVRIPNTIVVPLYLERLSDITIKKREVFIEIENNTLKS